MSLTENSKITIAKTLTELAIQNGLIHQEPEEEETAKNICKFFDAIVENIGQTYKEK